MTPQRHTGFSWNLGGLLGSAFGCSAWIALTPFVTGWHTTGVLIALGCVAMILLAVPIKPTAKKAVLDNQLSAPSRNDHYCYNP